MVARPLGAHIERCSNCLKGLAKCWQNLAYLDDVASALQAAASGQGVTTLPSDDSTVTVEHSRAAAAPESIPGYHIPSEIHRGGQGVVYKAVQLSTKRTVALKLLLDGPFAGAATRSRFQRRFGSSSATLSRYVPDCVISALCLGPYGWVTPSLILETSSPSAKEAVVHTRFLPALLAA